MMNKIFFCILPLVFLAGCSNDLENNKEKKQEQNPSSDIIMVKTYACDNDDFFYVEEKKDKLSINFLYGQYSSPLSYKPSKIKTYSDGVYEVSMKNNNAIVSINEQVVLDDCSVINNIAKI